MEIAKENVKVEEKQTQENDLNIADVMSKAGFKSTEDPKKAEKDSVKKEETTDEKKEASKTPTEEAATKEKVANDQHKGYQKRIDTLTYEKKTAFEENERLKKELEELKAGKKEPEKKEQENVKKDFMLTDEQFKEAVYEKAIKNIIQEDKDKPIEKRRILTPEEYDELLIDSPGKHAQWEKRFGDYEKNLYKSLDKEIDSSKQKKEPEEKVQVNNNEAAYGNFIKEYPELDVLGILKDIPKELLSEDKGDKLIAAVKEKDEEIGNFFEFIHTNFNKYSNPSTWVSAAKEFEKTKRAILEKQIEEQKAEIERLSNIEGNVRSTRSSTPTERKDDEMNSLINSVLKRTPYGNKG